MPKLIGLTGKARSGKDTVGRIIAKEYNAQTVSFAYPVKMALNGMFMGILDWTHWDGVNKENVVDWIGKSPRQMMQTLGTQWGRELVNENIWLLIAKKRIDECFKAGTSVVVVTDVRFSNEADMIRDMGGEIWHIRRDDAPTVNAHASEAGVAEDVRDRVISNNYSLESLELTVKFLFEDIRGKANL